MIVSSTKAQTLFSYIEETWILLYFFPLIVIIFPFEKE